jgi:fatty-acyl-CoA synthase
MLAALGVEPGDTVGVLGPNRPEWAIWAGATWFAGATLVPLQVPLRVRDPAFFAESTRSLITAAGCRVVLADPRFVSSVPEGIGVSWDDQPEPSGDDPASPAPDDAAVIQFTSGSTATPKGALITHRAVMAQMEILGAWMPTETDEHVMFGWVPFFHDLGLFYYLVSPIVFGRDGHYLPTERFAADPAEWLRLLGPTRATITHFLPSVIVPALRAARRQSDPIDLSALRWAILAAEPIDPDAADALHASAKELSLAPDAAAVSYGLAEAVLGVTCTHEGEGLHFDHVDLAALGASGVAVPAGDGPARRVAACGRPAPGTELRIVRSGEELPEREVGELYVRGPSLMEGYIGPNAPDQFVDGWLSTGDLGYLADGQLYITGRIKDMVIVMGHNYYPEDFEWAAGRLPGVRSGRCVAFANGSGDGVAVLVEPAPDADPEGLSEVVRNAVANAVGISPGDVLVLPPGTVEKTTSGKLRRSAMRDSYLRGDLPALPYANEAGR